MAAMSLLSRLFAKAEPRVAVDALYAATVAEARRPLWYRAGVPDTIDGRFDMLVAVLALVELECERRAMVPATVRLTELFVDDMEGQARQIGIGDPVVGKHVGKMVSALGGRIGAFRNVQAGKEGWAAVTARNIDGAGETVAAGLEAFARVLERIDDATLMAGRWGISQGAAA